MNIINEFIRKLTRTLKIGEQNPKAKRAYWGSKGVRLVILLRYKCDLRPVSFFLDDEKRNKLSIQYIEDLNKFCFIDEADLGIY